MAHQSLPSQPQTQRTFWQKVGKLFGWPFWAILIIVGFGVTGYTATSALLNLNNPKECESVYWPFASGSKRLYCAQMEAQNGDAESLLDAIALVSDLSEDHPLRAEINKNIKIWSEEVLVLGEQHFQAGNMEKALKIADQIPSSVASKEVIAEKERRWREIWERGEEIEEKVEAKLYETEWNAAFEEAGKLVDLDNNYWANRRYTQLITTIENAKAEGEIVEEAREDYKEGGLDNLLTALEKAEAVEENSYSYRIAQSLITDVGEALMAKAEENLEERNWKTVLKVIREIPSRIGREEEIADLQEIALAGSQAKLGTVVGLEDAIAQAERLEKDRPFYKEAQDLISRWEKEIEDVKIIKAAKESSQGDSLSDLREAVEKVEEVPRGNPRYQEAQQLRQQWIHTIQVRQDQPILNRARSIARNRNIEAYKDAIAVASEIGPNRVLHSEARQEISQWRNEIQRIEDRPILAKANRLANQGRLEAAIEKASEIGSNRALYSEAREEMSQWRDEIQRIEDRPILLEAISLANEDRLEAAIEKASEISSNRALYSEAQERIQGWRNTLIAEERLEDAQNIARSQTVTSLLEAIEIAAPARNSNQYRDQAQSLINEWSERLYAIAIRRADDDNLESAIQVAQQVPSESEIYQEVRGKIQQWQNDLED
ncbi:MAG: hypothetical protein ACLFRN_05600 [Halothece sp.]